MMGTAAHKEDVSTCLITQLDLVSSSAYTARSTQRLQPEEIAAQYLNVANQPRSVWTHECDFRPSREKW